MSFICEQTRNGDPTSSSAELWAATSEFNEPKQHATPGVEFDVWIVVRGHRADGGM